MRNGRIICGLSIVVVSLVREFLFPSQTPKNFLLGYFRNAARCQWGRVAVMVWVRDSSNLRGWEGLMLW